ncbi:MAG: SDR family oxidoreductase, partial [Acidimicrobiia bacterium]|nr:SDR family oxidoreductase [Acidimicrobiia bacterium]
MAVAVVTGGASGFGLALGDRCAATGMDVVLLDLDGSRAETEAERLASAHQRLSTHGDATDVSDAASVEAAATMVGEGFGAVDLLISNVGVQLFGAVERFTDDQWRWLLDVNVIGSVRLT